MRIDKDKKVTTTSFYNEHNVIVSREVCTEETVIADNTERSTTTTRYYDGTGFSGYKEVITLHEVTSEEQPGSLKRRASDIVPEEYKNKVVTSVKHYNKQGELQTPEEIFIEDHGKPCESGSKDSSKDTTSEDHKVSDGFVVTLYYDQNGKLTGGCRGEVNDPNGCSCVGAKDPVIDVLNSLLGLNL